MTKAARALIDILKEEAMTNPKKPPLNVFILDEAFMPKVAAACKHSLDIISGSVGDVLGKLVVSLNSKEMDYICASAKEKDKATSIETITMDGTEVRVRAITIR
jgi:hypothetical protein